MRLWRAQLREAEEVPLKSDVVRVSGDGEGGVRLRRHQARQKFGNGRKPHQCYPLALLVVAVGCTGDGEGRILSAQQLLADKSA